MLLLAATLALAAHPVPSATADRVAWVDADALGLRWALHVAPAASPSSPAVTVPLPGRPFAVAWAPDGSRACAATRRAVACSDGSSAHLDQGTFAAGIVRLAVDDARIVVARADGSVVAWDDGGASTTLRDAATWPDERVASLAVAPGSIVAVDVRGRVTRW